jgi:hypothetical protein
MASAEKLLHEAQYAFSSITFGESRQNKRNAARAKSLCMKIIRKYPVSMEAGEAHAILRRLGEEAYTSKMKVRHRHITQDAHHSKPAPLQMPQTGSASMPGEAHRRARPISPQATAASEEVPFDWSGLLAWLVTLPKFVLGIIAFAGFFLFGIFGPFIFLPLLALVLFTGPFRKTMQPKQREELNQFIVRANIFIAEQRAAKNR